MDKLQPELIQNLPFETLYALRTTSKQMLANFTEAVTSAKSAVDRRKGTTATTYLELFCREDLPLITQYVIAKQLMTRIRDIRYLLFPDRYFDLGLKLSAPIFLWPAIYSCLGNYSDTHIHLGVKLLKASASLKRTLLTGLSSAEGLETVAPHNMYQIMSPYINNFKIKELIWFLTTTETFEDTKLALRVTNGKDKAIPDIPFDTNTIAILTILLKLPTTFQRILELDPELSLSTELCKLMCEQWLEVSPIRSLLQKNYRYLIDNRVYLAYSAKHGKICRMVEPFNMYKIEDIAEALQSTYSPNVIQNVLFTLLLDKRINYGNMDWSIQPPSRQEMFTQLAGARHRDVVLNPALYDSTIQVLQLFVPHFTLKLPRTILTRAELTRLLPYITEEPNISFENWRRQITQDAKLMAQPLDTWPLQDETTVSPGYRKDVASWTGSSDRLLDVSTDYFGWKMACYRAKVDIPRLNKDSLTIRSDIIWALREFGPTFVDYIRSTEGNWLSFELGVWRSNIVGCI